jgi:peptide/nickel transport system substrate-binding protein
VQLQFIVMRIVAIMKRFSSILLAASSLLWALPALPADRPHYGGTLRVELRESAQSLDPAAQTATGLESLSRTVFETLVTLDNQGRPQPLLASSWQTEPGNQRWRFVVRSGVSFSDGTPLDASTLAASLRNSNPEWKALPAGDTVIIETETPDPDLPAELALARHSIVRRGNGSLIGTGPFVIAQSNAGQHLTLKANDQYWAGRPFVDSIEVEFGKNDRDQMMALDLGKADVVEVAPENIRRAQAENRVVMTSPPTELMALVFTGDPRSDDEFHARNALESSIDTAALNNVVLQGGGEPTTALLPTWLSGYGFVFAGSGGNGSHLPQSAQKRSQQWTLSFDTSDSVARVIAQRLALNARDAGITLDVNSSATGDLRLVRIPLASSDPHVALMELARVFQIPRPKFTNGSVAELYAAEKSLLQAHRVIPLLHRRNAVALRPTVHDFSMSLDTTWRLENVWLSLEKP